MKNKERIEQLEKQVQVLLNRVAILEMRAFPKVPASAPPEWPAWKPFWLDGPQYPSSAPQYPSSAPQYPSSAPQYPSSAPKPYRIIPMMDTQCSLHH